MKITKEQKLLLGRILSAMALLALCMLFAPEGSILSAVLFAVPYLLSGYDVMIKAAKNVIKGRQIFD